MKENKVLAVVEGKDITEKDVQLLMRSLPQQQAAQFYSEDGKKRLLNELINQQLFYLDAVEKEIDKEQEFIKELENAKENLLKQYAIKSLLSKVQVEEKEVKDYYDNNKEQFKEKESVKASHILVDGKEKADEILSELKNELSFDEAAKKYSKCPSKSRGGDLGFFNKGKMVPEFEKAAFSMDKEEISEPIKTQFGYHIIKVIDKKDSKQKTYEEAKDQIYKQLVGMKQNKKYLERTGELKEKYEVKIVE